MQFNESLAYFTKLHKSVFKEDLLVVSSTAKALCLPQKTLAASQHIFFSTKAECRIEPDDVVLVSAAINLACKVCETLRPLDKILRLVAKRYSIEIESGMETMYIEAISETEVEISVILDFNFEITEIYTKLERMCREAQLDTVSSKRCWIMLNDMMMLPLSVYFTADELLLCLLFINCGAADLKEDPDDRTFLTFVKKYNMPFVSFRYIKFICSRLLELYSP